MSVKILYKKYGCACECMLVAVVFVLVLSWHANYVSVRVYEKGGDNNFFPTNATDIGFYTTSSRVCYEYSLNVEKLDWTTRIEGWDFIPIPEGESVGITCFHYEKYKKGNKITKDYFYDKKISRGYYEEKHGFLRVYDLDTQRLYFTASR